MTIRIGGGHKPSEETLRERLAFNDPDRSTPLHDDICLWLDGWLKTADGAGAVVGQRPDSSWNDVITDAIIQEAQECVAHKLATLKRVTYRPTGYDEELQGLERWTVPSLAKPTNARTVETTWEYTVGTERWVSGFIDVMAVLVVENRHPSLGIHAEGHHYCKPPFQWSYHAVRETYAFEVKSAIPSLGELIRQVRYYQSKFAASYATTLTDQGIGFVEYPSGTTSLPKKWRR